jgi:hypothetical protein
MGDFIFPWSLGHLETWTADPSSKFKVSFTKGASHLPQVALTLMPQTSHSYVAMVFSHRCLELIEGVNIVVD